VACDMWKRFAGPRETGGQDERMRRCHGPAAIPAGACHCDPLCETLLDTGQRKWTPEWEYSGMNDPIWDLGGLSVEGDFDAGQNDEMLRAYFGGALPAPARIPVQARRRRSSDQSDPGAGKIVTDAGASVRPWMSRSVSA